MTLLRSVRGRTWALFRLPHEKIWTPFLGSHFVITWEHLAFQVENKDDIPITEGGTEESTGVLAKPTGATGSRLNQNQSWVSVTWNTKKILTDKILFCFLLLSYSSLFFFSVDLLAFKTLCVDSSNSITGPFLKTLVPVNITVELSHFYVGLEPECGDFFFFLNIKSPCGACHLRLVFVMLMVHSKTLAKFSLWIKL